MHREFLVGLKVYLRMLEESDITEEYISWLNNFEVTRYLEIGKFPSTPETVRKYLSRFLGSTTDFIFAIVERKTNEHIGNVTLNHINWVHRTGDTGILIGNKKFWRKGYGFEAWSLIIEYAFKRLGLRKITAGVVEGNAASLAVLEKLGFKVEGKARQEIFLEGQYCNVIMLGLFEKEFWKFSL